METKICAALAGLGALIGAFLGGVDGLLTALVAAVAVDYLTGVLAALREKRLSSEVGFWGLVKKVLIFVLVGLANFIDIRALGGAAPLRAAVIFFYLSNEGLSVLENYTRLGLPCPERLKSALAQLKKEDEGT